jgi:hypothetical protein
VMHGRAGVKDRAEPGRHGGAGGVLESAALADWSRPRLTRQCSTGCVASMCRSSVRADDTSDGLDVSWPDFGLARTPNVGNCCALLSNILAGQYLTCWPGERAYISTDQKLRREAAPSGAAGAVVRVEVRDLRRRLVAAGR